MIDKLDLATELVDYLNDLVELDKSAINALVNHRVPCNESLDKHPTVQAFGPDNNVTIGMLGILNGLCGVNNKGRGPIEAVCDKTSLKLKSFQVAKDWELHAD